jgi:hypothetical protein
LSIKQTAGTYVKAEKGIKIQGEAELMAVRLRLKRVKLVIAHVSLFRAKVSHGRLINNDVIFFWFTAMEEVTTVTVVMEINKDQLSH